MRLALRIAGAVLALLLLVLIAVIAGLQTEVGGRFAARALERIASTPGQTELRIGRLAPGLPFRLALSGLSIADKEGEWLAAERIEVRWRPLELLQGRLRIVETAVGGIRLSRLPEGAPEPEDRGKPFTLPSLPLDVTVDRFALDNVAIGAAVAGEEVHLRAAGEIAAWRDGQLRTDAEIVRTNGIGGSARLAARWQPASERLSLDLHAEEPEGGRLGSLLGLAGRPPVRLTFTGDGPMTGWEGRLDGAVGDAIGIVAGIASEKAEQGIRVHVSGHAEVAALLPEAARELASQGIDFTASFLRPQPGVLVIETADVGTGGMHLTASGGLDLADERFEDMHLTLSVADAAAVAPLLAPASLAAAEVRVRFTGPWTTPVAELAADVADLRVADATVGRSTLQGVLTSGAGGRYQADADATFIRARAGGTDIDALLGAPPNLRLRALFDPEGNTLAFDRIELLTPALGAEGRGSYALSSGDGRATLRASVSSLAAFAAVSGLDMAGRAALAVDARLAGGSLTAGLGLAADGLRSDIRAADVLLGPAPTLRAAVGRDATGALRLADLVLTGQGMRATAAATLQDQAVSAEYYVGIPDVAPVAAASGLAAGGTLALDGTLSGLASDPHAKAVLTLADGHVADVVASPVRIEVSADSVISRPRGLLTATASAAGEVLRLAVPFARETAGRLRLGPIDGSGAGARLSGTLSRPQEGGAIMGALSLRTGGEGRPVALAGHRLDGTAEVRLALGERNGEQTVDIDGSGHSLALATPDGPVGSAESLSLRARLAGTAEARGEVVLNVLRPTAGGTSLAGIDARVEGSPESARYDVTARLADDPAEAVQAGGTFAQEDGRTRITFASLDGQAGGQRLDLRRPLTVTLADGETVVEPFDLSVGDGTISGGGRMGPAGSQGHLLLNRLPLSLANALRPGLSIEGMLDGDASVRSEGEDLAGRLTLNLSGVRAAAMSQAPPLEASATASLGGGVAAAEVRVPQLGGGPLAFDASVPARVDARTLAVEVSEQAPLRGRLVWAGSVARLWELLPLPEQRLTGEANVDLALAGTVLAPELTGEAGLANGRYEHFIAATVIDGLSLQARSTGSGAIALSLRGNDGASGTITGDGRIALAGGTAPLVELVVTFTQATLVRRDDVTTTLSGAMTFRQDEAGASLVGGMTSDRMEIRLVDRLPPSVVVLDVTEINLPPEHAPRGSEPAPAAAGPAIALDIAVKLPRRVFVRGRGLESEWEGDLRVSGTSADPRIVGTVAVRSGTFDFAGKRFALETGEIGFTGGKPINPTLNVRATRTTPELTAVIRVIGTALEPEIELTSTPALPESEILSRVLFDKAVAKLGPVEAAQLAMALDTLASGESMSEDALSFVRNLLGLDVLTIEPGQEEGEGPAVGVGRYVAEGVYVGARQGATDESTAGTVEIEVLPGLAIESELSDSTEGTTGAVGLRWKWDY